MIKEYINLRPNLKIRMIQKLENLITRIDDFQKIKRTWEAARTCGASTALTVKEVLLPLMRKPLQKSLWLTAMWSSADFAISRVVATQEVSLAMRIDRLLSPYYFESAFGILVILSLVNFVFYFLIKGAFRVISQKS